MSRELSSKSRVESSKARDNMPTLALQLREIRRQPLKANAKGNGARAYGVLGEQGGAIVKRIWRSRVKSWEDVAARVVAMQFYYRDSGVSADHDRATRELINAVDLL